MRRAALLLLVLACKRPNHPPLPPLLSTAVETKHIGDSSVIYVKLEDPDGDMVAAQFDWGGNYVTSWCRYIESGDSIWFRRIWHDSGTYAVRVKARDSLKAETDWFPGPTISVGNNPPGIPEFTYFSDSGYAGEQEYYVVVRDSDPDADTVAVQLQWSDGDTTNWSDDFLSGDEAWFSQVWLNSGDYPIRARARDGFGALSEWTSPRIAHISGPALQWYFATYNSVASAPAVASDGTIYLTAGHSLVAVSPSGQTAWWCSLLESDFQPTPVLGPDGTVYVQSGNGYLYAVKPDGVLNWCHWVGESPNSAQLAAALGPDGTIYCSGESLYAFSPDGLVRWSFRTGRPPVVAADGTVYLAGSDSLLYALETDGAIRWTYPIAAAGLPAVGAGGVVYCVGLDALLYAITPQGGPLWVCALKGLGGGFASQPVVGPDGTIYCQTWSKVVAVTSNGTLKWLVPGSSLSSSSPVVLDDGTILVLSSDVLTALNSDGTSRWRYGAGSLSSPSVAVAPDGTIYVGSESGRLYALRGTASLADSPWPMYQHDLRHTGRAGAR
jgi:hypothetical protein